MARESVRNVRTGQQLAGLPDSHWKQFHDVRRPGSPGTRIEHVLVGPSGIHVLGYLPAGALPENAVTACADVADSAAALADVLPERYRTRVDALVCLRHDEPVAELVGGVTLTSLLALEHILRESPVVLSTCEVAEVGTRLKATLRPFPLPAPAERKRSPVRRTVLAWVGAAALVVAGVALGPDVVQAGRVW
ncbi:MAG TPA: nuclease-related domain-containing protein [Nocardioidaceae bacterium]|nr:nuclease-related domain-containing protein [Nocardioidaceae bacterium]